MEIVQEEYQDEWVNLEKEKPVYFFVKRVIDIVLSLCGLIILSPVFLLIAILIKKDDGGDVFYKHKRIGHMNQDIYLYKFRSMTSKYKTFDEFYQTLSIEQKEEWDENFKLENDPRITKIGNFLRKTSLDELPQIINILKGDMSIIGPRPVVDDEIEKYGKDKAKFLAVKPGLTGYWAANGRSATTYEDRINMELYYVDHCSLLLDIQIFKKGRCEVVEKKYSVLMSVYYKENPIWFDKSIISMMDQTIKPSEFVLVEDGPLTDELDKVVEKYENTYPNIFKIIKLPKNVGLGPALKKGVEECSYDFIARMDSDDYCLPERIEKQFEIFESNPDIGMVGTNVSEFIDTIENVVCNVILPETNEEIVDFSKKRNPLRHPSVMFKKSEILSAGNYREYYLCEDYDMWLRMIRNGCKCYNIQNIYVYMRIGEDFFKRRGGHKYFKSIKKFKKEQLHNGYFTKVEYLKTIIPHMIVCYMPNSMRDLIYRKLLRKQ